MSPLFETVTNLKSGAETLARRRYGVIEMIDGRLAGVHLRPWPRVVSLLEIWLLGRRFHRQAPGDRCLLYYNQPLGHDDFLALKYVVSSRDCRLKTFRGALVVLDEIARLKGSLASLCCVSNFRISDRLLGRWGWESHLPESRDRHFIKRFYGDHPSPENAWALTA